MIQLGPPLATPLLYVTPNGWYGAARPLRKGTHFGIDFRAPTGTPVISSTAGRVARVGWDPPVAQGGHGGGNLVIVEVRDADGLLYELGYMHLERVDVAAGQVLAAGDPIGAAGASGTSDGAPHLHFQIKAVHGDVKQSIDPTPLLGLVGQVERAKQSAGGGLTLGKAVFALGAGYLLWRA